MHFLLYVKIVFLDTWSVNLNVYINMVFLLSLYYTELVLKKNRLIGLSVPGLIMLRYPQTSQRTLLPIWPIDQYKQRSDHFVDASLHTSSS